MDKLYNKCKVLGILQRVTTDDSPFKYEVVIKNKDTVYIFLNGEQLDLILTKMEDIPFSDFNNTYIERKMTFELRQIEFEKEHDKIVVSFILGDNKQFEVDGFCFE